MASKAAHLWTVLVGAFLSLFAALGFSAPASATAPQAQPQPQPRPQSAPQQTPAVPCAAPVEAATAPLWTLGLDRSMPPTMKQRITAEAHGSSPTCRSTVADAVTTPADADREPTDVVDRATESRATPACGSDHENPP
ncbi:hypothetical protein G3I34_20365 [Streptomyces sp. SID8014]|uniref:DUF6344 domain-containing protein n=1 Tax=Streptomyces sp. SID8014 TaxID=2706097 RepID=UPI0013BC5F27|nr:DUF6344 domain-containing protein [Streptomyces sp. SID8014]NEC14574.1 hypothetical protein [Streptomyces sp. SID8014]